MVVDPFPKLTDEEEALPARRCSFGSHRAGGFDQGAGVGVDRGLEQSLLAGEVGVGGGGGEARLASDVGHRCAPEPVGGEAAHRDLEEAPAGPLALPGRHGQLRGHIRIVAGQDHYPNELKVSLDSSIRTDKAGGMTTTMKSPAATADRIARLSTASVRKVLEPEELFDWDSLGRGQVIGDELLTTSGLDLDLPADTKARLSREEVAAMLQMGIRFEAVLNAGFALRIAETQDVTDPR